MFKKDVTCTCVSVIRVSFHSE